MAQVQQTFELNCLLQACRQFNFLKPQHVHEPNTASQCAGWRYHSIPFGTVVPMKLFCQPEELSKPPGCQSKY